MDDIEVNASDAVYEVLERMIAHDVKDVYVEKAVNLNGQTFTYEFSLSIEPLFKDDDNG